MAKDDKKKLKEFIPAERMCPKCGVRMANHKERYSCGRCGFTEWKKGA